MGVHDGHRDRLRQRFLQQGLSGFEEHTALELLLFYARPRCDTNVIAHQLIARFGSLAAVMDAPMEELMSVEGVGYNTAVLIKMIPEMGALYLSNRSKPGEIINTTQKAGDYFMAYFVGKVNEEAHVMLLDDRRKLLRCVCIANEGIVNAVKISVKKIVAQALNANATAVILAHNHPGGIALPSGGDKAVTVQVYSALKHINVRLIDHIIVANDDYVSMADSGYIAELSML